MLAAYMAISQVLRYLDNDDASSIMFRRFLERSEDKYPTFTFCLNSIDIYSEAVTELHVTKKDYNNLLKTGTSSSNKSLEQFTKIFAVEHELLTKKLAMFLLNFDFRTVNSNNTFSYDSKMGRDEQTQKIQSAFHISHQDPDQICFTRTSQSKVGPSFLQKEDEVTLNLKSAVSSDLAGHFKLYIHYPGQLIRYMDKPSFHFSLGDMYGTNNDISLTLGYPSVLRRRPDAKQPCNFGLENDNNEFRLKVIRNVGCIPRYWTSLMKVNESFDPCETSNQFQDIYRYVQNFTNVIASYDPPCVEMHIPINAQQKTWKGYGNGFLHLSILYSDKYQEIQNVRDFNLETLWSSIGGFIGIFLGYSLLQLPELLSDELKTYWMAFIDICCGTVYAFTAATAFRFRKRSNVVNALEAKRKDMEATNNWKNEAEVIGNRLVNVEKILREITGKKLKWDEVINQFDQKSHK